MMAGALNFTLGLQANQFLNTLGTSSGKLLGFLGIAGGISAAFQKMWGSIDQGGKLNDLAASANLSVKSLYQLQRAFEDVGASADSVPTVINRLRRTLGSGEQNNLFTQIGLDPKRLAELDPGKQIESVAAAMAKLNVNARSNAAQQLFGREGATIAMQIANSGNDFADAMNRAESDAEIWQRVAKTFDDIGDKVTAIIKHIDTLWAQFTGAFIQAFKEGRVAELFADVISTGIRAGLAVVPGLFATLGDVLLRVFQVPLAYLQAGIEYTIDQLVNNPKIRALTLLTGGAGQMLIAGLDKAGVTSGQPSTFQEILQARLAEGVKFNFGNGEFGMGDITASANDLFSQGLKDAGELLSGLGARLNDFLGKLPQVTTAANSNGMASVKGGTRTDFTSIEKMGGVLLGLGRGFGGDDARQTANNTKRAADLLSSIDKKINKQDSLSFSNI